MDANGSEVGGQALLARPYHERQFIVMRLDSDRPRRENSISSLPNEDDAPGSGVWGRSAAQLNIAAGWAGRTMGKAYDGTRREYRRIQRRMGDFHFIDFGPDDIGYLSFPAGHPR